ncbi:MAG: sodium/solute symporter [Xanthomonadales bacterium]|jgi:SSS family solute:Na+ symporter|nr:sodium/solute symporter [Xanthomonadales bacterium]
MDKLDIAVVSIYVISLVIYATWFVRNAPDAKSYFLAGRSFAWPIIGISILATNFSGNGFIGSTGGGHAYGLAQANFDWIGAIPAIIIAAFIFVPRLWKMGLYSIPEYLGTRYDQYIRVIAGLYTACITTITASAALWAIALTLKTYADIPVFYGILLTTTLVGLYTIRGGMTAIAATDLLQMTVISVATLGAVWYSISSLGGVNSFIDTVNTLDASHFQVFLPASHEILPWPGVVLGLALVLAPAHWMGSQIILQRTFAARSAADAKKGLLLVAVGKLFFPLLYVVPGIIVFAMQADLQYSDQALPWLMKNVLPHGMAGLLLVALIAAFQSTLDSSLNSISLVITRDVYGVLSSKPINELMWGKILTFIVLLVAALLTPIISRSMGIYIFIQTALSVFQGPMFAILIFGVFSKWANKIGAYTCIVCGLSTSLLLNILDVNFLYVAFWSFSISVIGLAAGSWAARSTVFPNLK